MIEASVDMLKDCAEKEWYFGNVEKERRGPFSFPEVCLCFPGMLHN